MSSTPSLNDTFRPSCGFGDNEGGGGLNRLGFCVC